MARRRTPQVVGERAQKFHNVLAASSGVIVPSKLRPGEMPFQGPGEMRKNIVDDILCSVCGRCFNNNYHVKSHFRACVKRNGNPFGRVWDDDFLAWTADSDGVPVLLRY